MGWETRRNGRSYFYAYSWQGGRVVKRYVGSGPAGEYAERTQRQFERLRRGERIQRWAQTGEWDDLDGAVGDLSSGLNALVSVALTAAGYHRHDRGQWRKKRMATATKTAKTAETKSAPFVVPEDKAKRADIIWAGLPETSSNQAKSHAIACLNKYPDEISLATGKSILPILSLMSNRARPVEQAIREQEAGKMRRDLEGENVTPLEKMLVERVVACWLAVAFYETQFASKARDGGMDAATDDLLQKRIDRAHKRHLSAVKTLAQVRRLQVPVNVQINVAGQGGQQVNVAGNVTPQTPL